jgi:ABC-type cobalamin/Fe3+-siderophores transport system ATPase subunit
VADTTLLMLDQDRFAGGPAERILNEENLRALYGVEIRRVTMEREGRIDETLVPVFSHKKIEVFEN